MIAVVFACALAALMAGCGQGETEQINSTKDVENISFSWWGNDPRHLYTMAGVDLFMEKNPDINVNISYGIWNGYEDRNRVYMNSHTEPDVMQINYDWLSQYSEDGTGYYDLYQLKDNIDLSGYTEADLAFGEIDGKLNALPIAYNSAVVFYNKDLYDRYGLDVPKTWDDLFDAAEKMKGDGIYQLGAVKKHVFLMLAAYYEQTKGGPVFAADGTCQLDEDGMEYILNFYKRLIDEKVLLPIDEFDRSKLASGELAGSVFWISDISNYCTSIEEAGTPVLGDYISVDENDEPVGWYKKPATMYAISADTDHPESAAKLLDFLVNDPDMAVLQGTEKGIPVSSHALSAVREAGLLEGYSVEANDQMTDAGEALKTMVPAMEDETVIDAFKTGADTYLYDKADVSEAAGTILEAMGVEDSGTDSGIDDMLTDYYQNQVETGGEIAYISGVSRLDDGTYNQAIYDGIRMYANSAGVTYSTYLAKEDSEAAYTEVLHSAIDNGSRLIICSGVHYNSIVAECQYEHPEIAFLMIDGTPEDEAGNAAEINSNVHCVKFKEEESGYLAGYMTVLEGYRKLGFIGGEKIDSVERYGCGFIQGADAAAAELGCSKDVTIEYWYSGSFLPGDDIYEMAQQWYKGGSEIIFCCGGALYESVLSAADKCGGMLIGVDVDQSEVSERVLTSAVKGVDRAVVTALDDYFAYGQWSDELAGKVKEYGTQDWCGGLPVSDWRFENVTQETYNSAFLKIRSGEIKISDETGAFPAAGIQIVDYD